MFKAIYYLHVQFIPCSVRAQFSSIHDVDERFIKGSGMKPTHSAVSNFVSHYGKVASYDGIADYTADKDKKAFLFQSVESLYTRKCPVCPERLNNHTSLKCKHAWDAAMSREVPAGTALPDILPQEKSTGRSNRGAARSRANPNANYKAWTKWQIESGLDKKDWGKYIPAGAAAFVMPNQ
ncbi:hypothetical protein BJ166DRAFT_497951 [Pestalotiopsis sp. NC0098]|nr:hypothetical protein BJ166DRAFT_497951 [Pestalotiopsis sp. NC0098]